MLEDYAERLLAVLTSFGDTSPGITLTEEAVTIHLRNARARLGINSERLDDLVPNVSQQLLASSVTLTRSAFGTVSQAEFSTYVSSSSIELINAMLDKEIQHLADVLRIAEPAAGLADEACCSEDSTNRGHDSGPEGLLGANCNRVNGRYPGHGYQRACDAAVNRMCRPLVDTKLYDDARLQRLSQAPPT